MAALDKAQRQLLMGELPGLKRFCLSLTAEPADADDLLQVTVERLLQRGMPDDAHVAKWAYRVCKNLWIDELRWREVRQRHSAAEEDGGGTPQDAATGEGSLQLDRVSQAMAALPEDQRAALVLVAVEGYSYAEVAEILEIPIGTVMSRIARGRKSLAEKVEWSPGS
ncbi:RNA polymerase, sigma-24 subunit, ECF subfamily [Luminiphilus syltensis NOR5-1B]|uniref:RNA polymerase, sigma-24 subunit, ECF subfamily n=1 Tax=Luminiphilus syltensis NOR5-1B TaxID=565045 RepID=B8KXB6_9GAMM|nr:RNA polymerase sigma factor [Luminiphilus syltensis]EED36400.1 RNA polymerase, sigma-24 subunit, ECF subfamily [Luminiphilus syltensis NOR5-1B]